MTKKKSEKVTTSEDVKHVDIDENVAHPENSTSGQVEEDTSSKTDGIEKEDVQLASEEITEGGPDEKEAEISASTSEEDISEAEKTEETEEAEIRSNLEEELELAQQEAARNLENWQRAVAELANFKRRQEEQLKLQRDRIKSEVLQGVISTLDDMDLAFQNLPEEIDGQLIGWVEGFRLVQRKLDRILDEQNVMPIDTKGSFDPNFHEAVSYEESDEHETDTIIAELRKGYQIGNRVIRPALVRVAK